MNATLTALLILFPGTALGSSVTLKSDVSYSGGGGPGGHQ